VTALVSAAPMYASVPHKRAHKPHSARPYIQYRECLRLEFSFTCAYCLANEREVGPSAAYGGFEVEHFRPQGSHRFKHLKSFYPNLLWACHACNRSKGDSWPTPEEEVAGFRFVDPTVEALGAHLCIRGEQVVASSKPGQHMCDEINLNSALHKERRRRRSELMKKYALLEAVLESQQHQLEGAQADISSVRDKLQQFADAIAALRNETGIPATPPWDAPTSCFACRPVLTRRNKGRHRASLAAKREENETK
jgi:hypothetical protein